MLITKSMIRKAIRFSKMHKQINKPLKTRPLTQEDIIKRAKRSAKVHRQIFGY